MATVREVSRDEGGRGLARLLASIQKRLDRLERARYLTNASIDGGALLIYDKDGTVRGTIGQQADGTYGHVAQNAPPPPIPSAPIVTPFMEGVSVTWDGASADGSAWPLDFARVEIHVSTAPGFTPTDATQVGAFYNTKGGVYLVTNLIPGTTYYVRLVAANTSGTESDPTVAVDREPDSAPDATINPGSITSDLLADNAVTAAKLADAAVTADAIDTGAVTEAAIAAGAVTSTGLATGAVIATAIASGAVTADAIASGAVGAAAITDGSVTTVKIADDAVDQNKIADLAVQSAHLATQAVTSSKIAPNAVTQASIADFAVAVSKLTSRKHAIY